MLRTHEQYERTKYERLEIRTRSKTIRFGLVLLSILFESLVDHSVCLTFNSVASWCFARVVFEGDAKVFRVIESGSARDVDQRKIRFAK